jgi:hypothetical protein
MGRTGLYSDGFVTCLESSGSILSVCKNFEFGRVGARVAERYSHAARVLAAESQLAGVQGTVPACLG